MIFDELFAFGGGLGSLREGRGREADQPCELRAFRYQSRHSSCLLEQSRRTLYYQHH